ncbi:ExbD/TolR family protein [Leptolyngbya ohadii]|uniref:ExbD/TolR family protein n=1 Tax=Leptolyngbya ohadii TaxID=1962290 RepID=UPI000B59A1CB|nr:biopolymer transporter ExbD [Leptolyngbya ohadii]
MPIKTHLESSETDVRIEIIPLIDVIFCILTFFILAAVTLTRQTAINVDLPRAGTGAPQMRELLVVSVDPIGQTYLEKQPISRESLGQALQNFKQTNPDGLMVLYASKAASYNDVVEVLDLLRAVGGDRVALATLPDNGQSSVPDFQTLPGGLPGNPLPGGLNPQPNQLPNQLPGQSAPLDLSPAPTQSLPGSESPLPNSKPSTQKPGSSSPTTP